VTVAVSGQERAHITVRTYNTYNVSHQELSEALTTAGDLLASIGVDVRWRDCRLRSEIREHDGDRCGDARAIDELMVRIVRAPRTLRDGDELGFSYVDSVQRSGALATVFADRIHALASGGDTRAGTLLGRAMAHEMGHLLLGTTGHSPRGLMRQQWTVRSRLLDRGSQWQFSSTDAAAIRSAAAERSAERLMLALRTPTPSSTSSRP
jgi:hypothetical protein